MNSTSIDISVDASETNFSDRNTTRDNVFEIGSSELTKNIFIICCYSVIVLISIFGNLLVCSIVIRNRNMHSATYVFITNLALSDLLMTVLNIPFNVARLLLNDWPFGAIMCWCVPLMQFTSVYVSTFTMMCIAVDRYRVVSKPFRPRLQPCKAIQVTICIWLLAIFLSVPHAVFNKIDPIFTYRSLARCRTIYPKNTSRWITLFTIVTQYVLPLSVTGFLYYLTMARVWSRHVGVVTEAQVISQAKSKRTRLFLYHHITSMDEMDETDVNAQWEALRRTINLPMKTVLS
ncbi:hypothetical protein JTE90_002906 [Oedothorax gibbosus]|uniref:G-protein coupled receptors family 1 profile domain-containing protein n=1 Tax=Oedothorax gibbosus TaxID=931172 RepID=A0AAV6UBV3_9ARAC|nr:hypothetical protein JTE90_002906 [Oedothorax gibbosus]